MNTGRMTMRQIAEAAGVTPATVSMALANHPRISTQTRMRVQALAKELGYVPNPLVSALMRTRRQRKPETARPVIAIVSVFDRRDGWSNHVAPTVRQMREGVIERAGLRGYRTQEFWLNEPGMSAGRLSDILRARGIQGILLSPLPDHFQVPALKWEFFSAVAVTVPQPGITLTTVCSDHYFSMLQAMRECYRLGYRRPGLVLGMHLITRFHGRWEAGYLMSRHLLKGMHPVEPLRFSDHNFNNVDFPGWIKRHRPDVIVSTNADEVLEKLAKLGLKVPEDIGVVWTSCPHRGHPISGTFQNGQMIGGAALDAVIAMVERHECGLPSQGTSLMVEGEWNPGTTLTMHTEARKRVRAV